MATPKTVLTYPLNGTQKDFPIPFEYLARKFVQVTLIGQDRKLLVLNTDYRFSTRTTITTTIAWGAAQGYDLIEIRRYTSASERLVDFSDGSILRAYDLNTAQVQSLHIAEEGRDIATDTIGVDNNGQLDARGRRIVNLADAIADGDAVTLRQEKTWAQSALNQAIVAANQATIATNARVGAETARTGAETARTGAETARTGAESARDTAVTKASESASSASSSESARVAAVVAQNAAAASSSKAQQWASELEDVAVSTGLYSSYHYSRKASASAAAAAASAAAAVGVGPGYITGIHPVREEAPPYRSHTFTTGTAVIPGTGKAVTVSTPIVAVAPVPVAGTWYYAYLYDNAGTAAIEIVTTPPAAPYSGTARAKTGDTSRRFLCALLGSSTFSGIVRIRYMADNTYRYFDNVNVPPFRVLSAVTGTTVTTRDLGAVVPPTTTTAVVWLAMPPGATEYDVYLSTPSLNALMAYSHGVPTNSTRQAMVLPTNAAQQITTQISGGGGSLTLDVAGYGADR